MQFQIPQFIETEDRIVGPLTLKQFLALAIPAGLSFLMFLFLKAWLWFVLSAPLIGIGVALAFLKINGQQFTKVVANAFSFYFDPQAYVWQPKNPTLPKNETTLKQAGAGGFSLESVVRGLALKNAWRYIQTGSKPKEEEPQLPTAEKTKERYQIWRGGSGERRAAKRIDYR